MKKQKKLGFTVLVFPWNSLSWVDIFWEFSLPHLYHNSWFLAVGI